MSRISSISIGLAADPLLRLTPSSFSMTINGCPPLSSISWIVQMPGWFSCEAARASRTKRSSDFLSWTISAGINLSATCRDRARVFRLVHHAHATTTEFSNDAIVGDCLADSFRRPQPVGGYGRPGWGDGSTPLRPLRTDGIFAVRYLTIDEREKRDLWLILQGSANLGSQLSGYGTFVTPHVRERVLRIRIAIN